MTVGETNGKIRKRRFLEVEKQVAAKAGRDWYSLIPNDKGMNASSKTLGLSRCLRGRSDGSFALTFESLTILAEHMIERKIVTHLLKACFCFILFSSTAPRLGCRFIVAFKELAKS